MKKVQMRIKTKKVHFMPSNLEEGILYVAEEFGTAAHLCACGCGAKIRTPLDVTEWEYTEDKNGPTLYPSIGNWQQKCRSHYWIENGEVLWAEAWTEAQAIAGRKNEDLRRREYFSSISKNKETPISLKQWFKSFLKRIFKSE